MPQENKTETVTRTVDQKAGWLVEHHVIEFDIRTNLNLLDNIIAEAQKQVADTQALLTAAQARADAMQALKDEVTP